MRGLGKGVREFNDAKSNVKREIEESASDINRSVKE
jgi:sec-independent protein translocase protein TatA